MKNAFKRVQTCLIGSLIREIDGKIVRNLKTNVKPVPAFKVLSLMIVRCVQCYNTGIFNIVYFLDY